MTKTSLQNKLAESGRSMVEMLGVLAIIGVLSIGGIAGYTYGMTYYRANEIMNEVNIISATLVTRLAKQEPLAEGETYELETGDTLRTGNAVEVMSNGTLNTFTVSVSNVPNKVATRLENLTGDKVTVESTAETDTEENPTGQSTVNFTYDNWPDAE